MSVEDNRKNGQHELSKYVEDQIVRNQIRKNARSKHKDWYWDHHKKNTYKCPGCGRGIKDVEQFEVHHKDRNPLNGSPENLVAFCRRCHHLLHDYEPPESLEDWKTKFANVTEVE